MSEEKYQELYYRHEEKDTIFSTHKAVEFCILGPLCVFCKAEKVFPNSSRFFHEPLDAKLWAASYNYPGHTGLTLGWVNKQGHVQLSEWLDRNVRNQELWGFC